MVTAAANKIMKDNNIISSVRNACISVSGAASPPNSTPLLLKKTKNIAKRRIMRRALSE